jgi:hypothetical protein
VQDKLTGSFVGGPRPKGTQGSFAYGRNQNMDSENNGEGGQSPFKNLTTVNVV